MSLYRTCSVDTLNRNVAKSVPRSQSTSVNLSSAVEVSNTLQPRAKVPSWYRDLHHAVLLTDTDDSVDGSDVNNSVRQRTDSMDVEISFNLPRRHHRGKFVEWNILEFRKNLSQCYFFLRPCALTVPSSDLRLSEVCINPAPPKRRAPLARVLFPLHNLFSASASDYNNGWNWRYINIENNN